MSLAQFTARNGIIPVICYHISSPFTQEKSKLHLHHQLGESSLDRKFYYLGIKERIANKQKIHNN